MSEKDDIEYMTLVLRLKADVDVLFTQLKSGDYSSPDTFANNLHHLLRMVKDIEPFLAQSGLIDRLARTDLLLTADLLGIVSSVAILGNFIHCLSRQAAKETTEKPKPDAG